MADTKKYPSIQEKLQKTDVLSTDVIFKLRDIVWYTTSDGTDTNITAADFGDVGYGVFEPRTARQEFFTFDPTTIGNFATTGVSITARGLKPGADYVTQIPGLKFNHSTGSKVLLYTNAPAFYNDFGNKHDDETIDGVWTFTQGIIFSGGLDAGGNRITNVADPIANTDAANKQYVDNVAVSGAPNANETTKGIVQLATNAQMGTATSVGSTGARLIPPNDQLVKVSSGVADQNKIAVLDATGTFANGFIDKVRTWTTVQSFTADNAQITTAPDTGNDATNKTYVDGAIAVAASVGTSGEAITAGQALYFKASDGFLYRTNTGVDESTFSFAGFSLDTVGAAGLSVRYVGPGKVATSLAGLTPGSYYFLNGAAGAIAVTPGARFAKVGQAISATSLRVVNPSFFRTGSLAPVAVGSTVITTGFYPSKITLWATAAKGGVISSPSISDEAAGFYTPNGVNGANFIIAGNAFSVLSNAPATLFNGTANTKTQTGFTITVTTFDVTAAQQTVYWTAESL